MFCKNSVLTSDDAVVHACSMANGESKAMIMNLPAILKDRGPLGNGFLSVLARIRSEPELLEYRKDFENLIDKIGRQPSNNMVRALEALNEAPMVITRATLDLIHQSQMEPLERADIRYKDTDAGPVVTFELGMGPTKLTTYINPLTVEGQGYLMAAWQFPMITWALGKPNEIISVQHYDARHLADSIMEMCNRSMLRRRLLIPDFRTAVAQVKLMSYKPTS